MATTKRAAEASLKKTRSSKSDHRPQPSAPRGKKAGKRAAEASLAEARTSKADHKPQPSAPGGKKAGKPTSVAAAEAAPAEGEWKPGRTALVLRRLRARWPALSDQERAELDVLSDGKRRGALGGRTKARGVLGDGTRWAVLIDKQLRDSAVARAHYHPKRFAYYLERAEGLLAQLVREGARGAAKGAAQTGAKTAAETAKEKQQKLLLAMERFAGKRAKELEELANARKARETDEDAAGPIGRLVTLAKAWREVASLFLLEVSGLSKDLVDEASAAADALSTAGADASEAGPAAARDSAEVNVLEGWLLEEMERAQEDFDAANLENSTVPRLSAGKATRQVLGTHARAKTGAKSPEAPPAPPPGAAPSKAAP